MSPNESDLRAALRDGQGDGPDAGHLLAHVQQVRRARRQRIRSIASGVAVVAVIGVGGTFLVRATSSGEQASDAGANAPDAASLHRDTSDTGAGGSARAPIAGPARSASSAAADATADAVDCPATLPHLPTGSVAPGTPDLIFTNDVVTVIVCGYLGNSSDHRPPANGQRAVVSGAAAATFVSGVNSSSSEPDTAQCLRIGPSYALLGLDDTATIVDIADARPACSTFDVRGVFFSRSVPPATLDDLFPTDPSPNIGSPLK